MKTKMWILLLLLGLGTGVKAQIENPVHWGYGTKKLPDGVLEVHLLATMEQGWHIYAQVQSKDAVGIPTKIVFSKDPGVVLIGKTTEVGKKEKYTIEGAGITNLEYAGKVDFVQKVRVKPGIEVIKGKITYQTCTHEKCLNEKTVDFSIPVK